MSEDFKALGQVLRFPVFLAGVALWTMYIFPFVLGFTLFVTIAHPICVPVLYALAYIAAAFSGESQPPNWDAYWKDYPTTYILWLRVGYRGMYHWLCHGSAA